MSDAAIVTVVFIIVAIAVISIVAWAVAKADRAGPRVDRQVLQNEASRSRLKERQAPLLLSSVLSKRLIGREIK